jgi:hypothetical protein
MAPKSRGSRRFCVRNAKVPTWSTQLIIARNSTFTYKGQVVDVKQVGRELACAMYLKSRGARIEYIFERAIEAVGPEMGVGCGVDQLRGDADSAAARCDLGERSVGRRHG